MTTPQKKLEEILYKFSDEVHDLAFDVQDNAEEGNYHEFLKLLKLLQGSPLFNTIVRSTSKAYVRRFNEKGEPDQE